jgi:hypothetical protein
MDEYERKLFVKMLFFDFLEFLYHNMKKSLSYMKEGAVPVPLTAPECRPMLKYYLF